MALAISEEHRSLADVVRDFVSTHDLRRANREMLSEQLEGDGRDAEIAGAWKQVAELGWTGLHLPEQFGGAGYGLPELAVVVEQFGVAAAPAWLLASVVTSAVIDATADDDRRAELLPGFAAGSTTGAVDLAGPGGGASPDARGGGIGRDASSRLTGAAGPVLGAAWADVVLVQTGPDLAVLRPGTPGVAVEPVAGLDPALGMAFVTCDDVAAVLLPGAAATALRIARTLAAAEAAGGARATLDMATEYAKVREQFGRIIGGFQAIKHHLATMLVDAERATAAAWNAARTNPSADDQADSRRGAEAHAQGDLAAAVAAAVALDAYQRNAQMNIQVHGGIGFTWEHDAHLYLRRAVALTALLGSVEQARDDVYELTRRGVRPSYAVDLPPVAEQFRQEARAFVEQYVAVDESDRRELLVTSGYLLPHWRRPWGRGAGPVEQLVIDEEFVAVDVPNLGIGGWVLLTLTQHASAEQIERWIMPSLRGELVWCQLFSEPNAGSDAAAVQTKAVRIEGGWLVNGQKVWTTGAQLCNRGLATVRTNPAAPKHRGITTVVVDLHAAGVDVRPLREITGDALFNEVFFNDVFVPDADVVGEVDAGWTVARATLGNERVSIGGGTGFGTEAADLVELLATHAPDDSGLARELGALVADEQAMRLINLRQVERAVAGAEPGAEGAVTKLLTANHAQHVSELAVRIVGVAAVDGSLPRLTWGYLMARAMTIAGGTTEISKNVIAERLLGLPRDPLVK